MNQEQNLAHQLVREANALWGEGWKPAIYRGRGTAAKENARGEMEIVRRYYGELLPMPVRQANQLFILGGGMT